MIQDASDGAVPVPSGVIGSLSAGETLEIDLQAELTGFGIRFAPFRNGDVWRLRVSDSPLGHTTYSPSQDFSVGSDSYRIVSGGDEVVEYRPLDSPGTLRIRAARDLTLARTHPSEAYSPASWAHGLWLGGDWRGLDQSSVLSDSAQANAHSLHFPVRLVDFGWQSDIDFLQFDRTTFPSPEQMIDALRGEGTRTVLWWSPWLDATTEAWRTASRRGWLVQKPGGGPSIFPVIGSEEVWGSYLDVTASAVAEAIRDRFHDLADMGVSGVKIDFGEALPDDVVFSNEVLPGYLGGNPHLVSRNSFVYALQHLVANSFRDTPDGSVVIARSGWTGSEAVCGTWLGDQSSDLSRFAGLGSVFRGYQSAIESGRQFVGMDIGGYFGTPSAADLRAWMQLSVAMPFALYHGLGPRSPWQFGDSGIALHKRTAALRCRIVELGGLVDPTVRIELTDDHHMMNQLQTDKVIVPLYLGRPCVTRLPEGQWECEPLGKQYTGPTEVTTEPTLAPCAFFKVDD